MNIDPNEINRMALIGYQRQLEEVNQRIAEIRSRLGRSTVHDTHTTKKHRISEEGRKRIAEAQRRRWAAHKKE